MLKVSCRIRPLQVKPILTYGLVSVHVLQECKLVNLQVADSDDRRQTG